MYSYSLFNPIALQKITLPLIKGYNQNNPSFYTYLEQYEHTGLVNPNFMFEYLEKGKFIFL